MKLVLSLREMRVATYDIGGKAVVCNARRVSQVPSKLKMWTANSRFLSSPLYTNVYCNLVSQFSDHHVEFSCNIQPPHQTLSALRKSTSTCGSVIYRSCSVLGTFCETGFWAMEDCKRCPLPILGNAISDMPYPHTHVRTCTSMPTFDFDRPRCCRTLRLSTTDAAVRVSCS